MPRKEESAINDSVVEIVDKEVSKGIGIHKAYSVAAEKLKLTTTAVRKRYKRRINKINNIPVESRKIKSSENSRGVILTETQIRQKHDCFYQIDQSAKKLKKGEYVTDADFREFHCKLSSNVYRRYADSSEFVKYKAKGGQVVYWSHPESIQKMKDEGVLS